MIRLSFPAVATAEHSWFHLATLIISSCSVPGLIMTPFSSQNLTTLSNELVTNLEQSFYKIRLTLNQLSTYIPLD